MLPENVNTALLVEFEAADDAELAEQLASLEALAGRTDPCWKSSRAMAAAEQKQLWAVRKAAVPLLQKLPGPKRIAEFIEDVTVHPDVLAALHEHPGGHPQVSRRGRHHVRPRRRRQHPHPPRPQPQGLLRPGR